MPKKKSPDSLRLRNSTAEFLTFAYQTGGDGVEVRVQEGTIWLSQKGMGQLFETTPENVLMHLKNIFAEKELAEDSVAKVFLATAADGKNYRIKHYNLDAIIAIGYRVNSGRATAFRQWATGVLRDYTLRGYVMDRQRMENGAYLLCAIGATYESPGQRPGCRNQPQILALKGRHKRCLNPSHVFTSTWSSARRTERHLSAQSANTSPVNVNIIRTRHFKTDTGRFWRGIKSRMMNGMFGIDPKGSRTGGDPSGLKKMCTIVPRALPWAGMDRPVGAGLMETYQEERNDE